MSEEDVETGFLNGLEAYSFLKWAAKAEPRKKLKLKEFLQGLIHVASTEKSKLLYGLSDLGLQCHSTEYVFQGESGTLLPPSLVCSKEVRLFLIVAGK